MKRLASLIVGALALLGLGWFVGTSSSPVAAPFPADLGSEEIVARLMEVPPGAVFRRELYHYATVLRYEVVSCRRGQLRPGATIYVAHYDPWKPRAEAGDARVGAIGGNVQRFVAGDRHHLALAHPLDDHYMGGLVDKYHGQRAGVTYWALRTDVEPP
jgi:hypothetical protein